MGKFQHMVAIKRKKITAAIGDELLQFVSDKPTATIEKVKRFLSVKFPTTSLSNT